MNKTITVFPDYDLRALVLWLKRDHPHCTDAEFRTIITDLGKFGVSKYKKHLIIIDIYGILN